MKQQKVIPWTVSVVAAGLAAISQAGVEETLWLDSNASSMNVQVSTQALLTGTLIGNWDEATNPGGTKTMLGVWGEEGNEPIPLDIRQELDGGGTTNPTGSYDLIIDTGIGLIGIQDLDVDVLGAETRLELPIDSTIYMQFDTFRTYNPLSLFVGGFEIPLPAGSGTITSWSMVQDNKVAGGVLVETGNPGEWTFSIEAEVSVSIAGQVEGQPFEFPPLDLILLIDGTCVDKGGTRTITMTFDELLESSQEFPPIPLPGTPIDLPTILPPGDVAHVILEMDLIGFEDMLSYAGVLVAHGDAEQVPGDATGDGHVNVDDLLVIISEWGPCAGCAGDLNGDGVVGVDDLLVVLANWGL